jgi:predicted RNA binding protein YcfA (HicA-like mRNA interferase family)
MKTKEAIRLLSQNGFVHVRNRGDHYIYKHPTGILFSLCNGGKHNEVSPGLEAKMKRMIKSIPVPTTV